MTLMVTEKCSWSQGKSLTKICGDLSLTLMGKTSKFPGEYSSSFDPDDRHTSRHEVEDVGESEGFIRQGYNGSEDSYIRKRRCISLNADKSDGFFIPMQVISLSKMSGSEKKNVEMRFRRELGQVQKFQKKILSRATMKQNGIGASSSGDPLIKKPDRSGKNVPTLKCGISCRFESTKQGSSPSSIAVMKQCETLLKRLMARQYAWIFSTPVDVVKLNIPDYFTLIKQPMDLGTVKSKLVSGAYSSPQDFASDVRLTFSNAMTYNPRVNDVYVMANGLNKFFEMRWKSIEKKIVVADMAVKRETKAVMPTSESLKEKIPQEDHVSGPKMTAKEKLNLCRRLSLTPDFPKPIVDFLRRHTDNAKQGNEDEIEIDFDSLSADTLLQLKRLLDDYSQGNNMEQLEKTELCEMEVLVDSGLSYSSMHPCKGHTDLSERNGPANVDEDLDICGNDPPIASYSPVDRGKNTVPISSSGCSSSSSSSKSGSSSSDSDSGTWRSGSNMKVPRSLNSTQENEFEGTARDAKGGVIVGVEEAEESGDRSKAKAVSYTATGGNGRQEGESAPSERQVSPDKLYRAALMRSRFADTIFKAREKTLDQGENRDPEKLRREREELDRQQRDERARLQAEAKAAKDARLKAEAQAAAEARKRRELEREAARQALLQMEKTVEINENIIFLKDLEMLRTAAEHHLPGSDADTNPDCSNEGIDGFKFCGSNPLEQLGLFMKADDEDEDEGEDNEPIRVPVNDVEEGEID